MSLLITVNNLRVKLLSSPANRVEVTNSNHNLAYNVKILIAVATTNTKGTIKKLYDIELSVAVACTIKIL
jgi:hypothetical protein